MSKRLEEALEVAREYRDEKRYLDLDLFRELLGREGVEFISSSGPQLDSRNYVHKAIYEGMVFISVSAKSLE